MVSSIGFVFFYHHFFNRGKPMASRCATNAWIHIALAWSTEWPHANTLLVYADAREVLRKKKGRVWISKTRPARSIAHSMSRAYP